MQTDKLALGIALAEKIKKQEHLVDTLQQMSVITKNVNSPDGGPNPLVISMFRRNCKAEEVHIHSLFPINPEVVLSLCLHTATNQLAELLAEFDNL